MKQLGSIEDCLIGIKKPNESNSIEKLHSIDEFSKEVNIVFVFVGSDKFHNKRGR
jgi:hypothetical protein